MPLSGAAGGNDGLSVLHDRLEAHFRGLRKRRDRHGRGLPLFALEHGLTDAELVLLHVVDPYSVTSSINLTRAALDNLDERRKQMKKYLEEIAQPLRDSGVLVRTEVMSGDPAETIIEYLKSHPTQLVVMATRGKRGLSRMVFGSVTESVIHMVKLTPLLLVSGGEGRG